MGSETRAHHHPAEGNYPPQPGWSGGAQTVLVFAVLLMQVALLVLGFKLYMVKSEVANPKEAVESNLAGNPSKDPEGLEEKAKIASPVAPASRDNMEYKPSPTGPSADMSKVFSDLNDKLDQTKKDVERKLDAITSKIDSVDRTLTKDDGVIDEINKIKTVNNEFSRQTELLRNSLITLPELLTTDKLRTAAESDVIVIASDTGKLPIRSFLSSYQSAIVDNPSRVWFKNHRVGLWTEQGGTPTVRIPIDNKSTIVLDEKWLKLRANTSTEEDFADPTKLARSDLITKLKSDKRVNLTRLVLVLPADTAAPKAEGAQAWGDLKIDVVLVAQANMVPTDLLSWIDFCSGRGLLSLLRPPVAPPVVTTTSTATTDDKGKEKGKDKDKDKDKEKSANATETGTGSKTTTTQPAVVPPKPDAQIELLRSLLTRELIRLTQPSPPPRG